MTGCKLLIRILSVAFLPLMSSCSSSDAFKISGHVSNIDNGTAILNYTDLEGGSWRDTTEIKKGNFIFKGTIDDTYNAQVFIKQEGKQDQTAFLILEPGDIIVNVASDKSEATGTKNNLFYSELNKATAGAQSREDLLKAMLECIRQHKDCEYAAFLYGIYFADQSLDEFVEEFNSFSEAARNSILTKSIRRDIEYRTITAPGKEASAFTLKDVNGNDVSLVSFRGKYVILDFWASWCVPCRQGVPAMKDLYAKYRDKGLEIIAVSQDSDHDSWKKAVADDGAEWIHLIDETLEDKSALVGSAYGVRSIPAYFLLDKEGRFIGKFDHDELERQLETLL